MTSDNSNNDQIKAHSIPDPDASTDAAVEEVHPPKAKKIPIKSEHPSPPQVRTTAPLPPPPPTPAIVPNLDYIPKVRKVSKGAPKCVYFRDATQLDALENLSTRHPRATASAVIQQLVQALLTAEAQTPNAHTITFETTIYL